ncbi:MAG: ATP-binding protein [Proteobacteria bacterium]|nr:ATP-binding protein [Pseudomonadota bacterium]
MSEPTAFAPTANPGAYVPWRGSERALAGLERWAFDTKNATCALTGRAGMGKTLLLKLFAARARLRFRTAFVSYPDCDPDDLCRAAVHELGGISGDC